MRLNNYSDTHSHCQAISSRCDLEFNDTEFPFGAIDSKVTSSKLVFDHDSYIISGPTTEVNNVPFTWSNWT